MKKFLTFIMVLCLLLLLTLPSYASPWYVRSGEETVEKGQVITGDLFFNGERLEVNGEVKGDLLVWASDVVINGKVDGNILGVVWGKLVINGVVDSHVRGFANEIAVNGRINGSLTSFAVSLVGNNHSWVEKGIYGTFSKIDLKGTVNGPADLTSAGFTKVGGRINGYLNVKGAPIEWQTPVEVTGAVYDYSGEANDPAKLKGVKLGGGYHLRQEKTDNSEFSKMLTLITIIWFIGGILMTLIFYRLFPRTFWVMTEPSHPNFRRSLLIGTLSLLLTPLLIFILIFTGVGIPIAVLLALLYVMLLLFAVVPFNLWLGRILFKSRFHPSLLIVLGGIIGGVLLMFFDMIPIVKMMLLLFLYSLSFGMIIGSIKLQIHS